MTNYTEEFLRLYDNKEKIPEFILHKVLCTNKIIVEEFSDNRRWSRAAISIISIPINNGERLFAIYWDEGLTECQDNNYWDAAEVEYKADMRQVKVEIVTEKYIDMRTGDVATSIVKTTELE
jgi:hypothetical protein